jgi:hypothetical protein
MTDREFSIDHMFGQLAFDAPDEPDEPDAGVVVLGVVDPVVAACAATAPPVTRAPETAITAAALRIGLMFTSSIAWLCEWAGGYDQ